MSGLALRSYRFDPAKDFFDAFPFSLTHLVAFMPCRASVNRAAARTLGVLRNMRRHIHAPHLTYEVFGVVCFISCERNALDSFDAFGHHHCRNPLCSATALE